MDLTERLFRRRNSAARTSALLRSLTIAAAVATAVALAVSIPGGSGASAQSSNLLTNGSFEAPLYLEPWALLRTGASAVWAPDVDATDGGRSARIWVNSSPAAARVQLHQDNLPVSPVEQMCLTFDAKTSEAGPILVRLTEPPATTSIGLSRFVSLGPSWSAHALTFRPNSDTETARLTFMIGQFQRNFTFDNIALTIGACDEETDPPATPTPEPSATATASPTATATPTPTPIPTSTPTATPIPTSTATPIPTATPMPTATPIPPELLVSHNVGISTGAFIDVLPAGELADDMALVDALGVRWVRLDINWRQVEPLQGTYDWTIPDRLVAAAHAEGLEVLGLVTYAPDWALRPDRPASQAPFEVAGFANFAAAAAQRYGPQGVSHWEIWNEPNLSRFWPGTPNGRAYGSALREASASIRLVQPTATILTGGLAPAVNEPGVSLAPTTFVNRLYVEGHQNDFDAIAIHPYSFPELPSHDATWNTFYRLQDVRNVMETNGDGAKQIWSTEFGAPTGTAERSVSGAQQRDIILEGVECASTLSWLGPIFLYQHRNPPGATATDLEENFGLAFTSRLPKPVWNPLVTLLGEFSAAQSCPL